LLDELETAGAMPLHARLAQVDPAAAARLHPNDARRVVRALEVFETTGQPISKLQATADAHQPAPARHVFVLDWPREELHERINARVEQMFASGLVAEVEQLRGQPGGLSRTAAQAVGYREVLEHLAGERDLAATIELVKLRTRQFAKRQLTWFRSLSECRAVAMRPEETPAMAAARIVAMSNVALT
jgi:tRNA dimethylallyltransferase